MSKPVKKKSRGKSARSGGRGASKRHVAARPRKASHTTRRRKQVTKGDQTGRTPKQQTVAGDVAVGNVDRIRDILFGNQMQDYDRRFERLEKRVAKAASDLREDTKKRLDSLEKYIRKETETLLARIGAETDERTEAVRELSHELQDTSKKLRALTEKTTAAQRELHGEILDQSKSLRDELRKKQKDLTAELHAAAKELRGAKVDRTDLAAMFVEVAKRLGAGPSAGTRGTQDAKK